jgi:hypothetical protein
MLLSLSLGDEAGGSSVTDGGFSCSLFVIVVVVLRAGRCCFVPSRGLSSCLCFVEGRGRSRYCHIERNKGGVVVE